MISSRFEWSVEIITNIFDERNLFFLLLLFLFSLKSIKRYCIYCWRCWGLKLWWSRWVTWRIWFINIVCLRSKSEYRDILCGEQYILLDVTTIYTVSYLNSYFNTHWFSNQSLNPSTTYNTLPYLLCHLFYVFNNFSEYLPFLSDQFFCNISSPTLLPHCSWFLFFNLLHTFSVYSLRSGSVRYICSFHVSYGRIG